MKIPALFAIASLGLAPLIAHGDDVAPGLWETTLEVSVDAEPGFSPGPLSTTQCFRSSDTRDPAKLIAPVTTPESGDCTYVDRSYVGNHFKFRMRCSGTLKMDVTGDVTLSPQSVEGVLVTTSEIAGSPVEMRSRIHGRRLGDC